MARMKDVAEGLGLAASWAAGLEVRAEGGCVI